MRNLTIFSFLGPQGSGKDTQADHFARKYGITVFIMGHLLREEAKKDTPEGRTILELTRNGELVPTETTIKLIARELEKLPDAATVILDGFPRTIEQAEALEKIVPITTAIEIQVPRIVSIKRLSGRLMCSGDHIYNIFYFPPLKPGVCDIDGLPLRKRPDDEEAAVNRRLDIYEMVTTKLLDYYRKRGILRSVNGYASVGTVAGAIDAVLKAYAFENKG